jgi:amidohydrolase
MKAGSRLTSWLLVLSLFPTLGAAPAPKTSPAQAEIDRRADAVAAKAVAWRRDLHQNPELGNREVRTAKLIAEHLRTLGLEVKTGVAHTGVVGVLKGGRPGRVVVGAGGPRGGSRHRGRS